MTFVIIVIVICLTVYGIIYYINPKLKYLTEFLKLETLTDNERMMIKDHIQSLEFIINSLYKI